MRQLILEHVTAPACNIAQTFFHLLAIFYDFYTPAPEERGYTVLPLYVCLSETNFCQSFLRDYLLYSRCLKF